MIVRVRVKIVSSGLLTYCSMCDTLCYIEICLGKLKLAQAKRDRKRNRLCW
jgi:hypothetical protein